MRFVLLALSIPMSILVSGLLAGCTEEDCSCDEPLDGGQDGGDCFVVVECLEGAFACEGQVLFECRDGLWEYVANCSSMGDGWNCVQGGTMADCVNQGDAGS
jgi:hypothetical protein